MSAPLPDLPELALFDRRATRGAVVRGLLRTAMIALGLYLAFSLVGALVGTAAELVHGQDRFDRLGPTAFDIGHPDLLYGPQGSRLGSGWTGTTVRLDRVDSSGRAVRASVHMGLTGRLSAPTSPATPLDAALLGGPLSRARAGSYAAGLPASSVTDVVVTLRQPLDGDAVALLLGRLLPGSTLGYPVACYGDVFRGRATQPGQRVRPGDRLEQRPVCTRNGGEELLAWTRSLRPADDDDLAALGLPPSRELRALGREPAATALYLQGATPADLRRLLADAGIDSWTPVTSRLGLPGGTS